MKCEGIFRVFVRRRVRLEQCAIPRVRDTQSESPLFRFPTLFAVKGTSSSKQNAREQSERAPARRQSFYRRIKQIKIIKYYKYMSVFPPVSFSL